MSQQTSPKIDSSEPTKVFVNVSAYKFVPIDDPVTLRKKWLPICKTLGLKGTILLSDEGINMFVAGSTEALSLIHI